MSELPLVLSSGFNVTAAATDLKDTAQKMLSHGYGPPAGATPARHSRRPLRRYSVTLFLKYLKNRAYQDYE